MRRLNRGRGLAIGLLLLALGGCKFLKSDCNAPQVYEGATSVPSIKAPEGLASPSTKNAMVVSAFDRPIARRGSKDKCLDTPPPYYVEKAAAPAAAGPAVAPATPESVTPASPAPVIATPPTAPN